MPPTATQREFCRRLFRTGGSTDAARQAFLDDLADSALAAREAGTALIGTSAGGASAQFELFSDWTPDEILQLIDAARAWAAESTVEAALALIIGPVREVLPNFSMGLSR